MRQSPEVTGAWNEARGSYSSTRVAVSAPMTTAYSPQRRLSPSRSLLLVRQLWPMVSVPRSKERESAAGPASNKKGGRRANGNSQKHMF